jgi:hypothetical protein
MQARRLSRNYGKVALTGIVSEKAMVGDIT